MPSLKLNIQKTKIMVSGPITSWEIDRETVETVSDFIFLDSKISADGANKGPSSQSYGFSSSHVWMSETWTIKRAKHWRIDAFELWCWRKLLSPLDCKEIQPINPKGNQSWIFIGRTDAEAPILWPPDAKSWLIRKDSDAEIDWRQEEKGTTEDETVGWHHWLDRHEFE